jgi:hypothetical protein
MKKIIFMKFSIMLSSQFMKFYMVTLLLGSLKYYGKFRCNLDWYIEESFSYIRVYGCFTSPHALPKFLPDRLICREVAYQTVYVGITKELKATQKRVWPTYPIQVGEYSLLDFGHAKVEASALEDITLSSIEFKRHDPHKVVENHLAQFSMKKYFHEDSPFDDIFKGEKSYDEVLSKIQTLPNKEQSYFLNFQKHRRSCLPNILQVEQSFTHNGNPSFRGATIF